MRKPRYTYRDTPKGMMETDNKTGKRKFIPIHPRKRKSRKLT